MLRIVVNNKPAPHPVACKSSPADMASELDPQNPNRRAMILVPEERGADPNDEA